MKVKNKAHRFEYSSIYKRIKLFIIIFFLTGDILHGGMLNVKAKNIDSVDVFSDGNDDVDGSYNNDSDNNIDSNTALDNDINNDNNTDTDTDTDTDNDNNTDTDNDNDTNNDSDDSNLTIDNEDNNDELSYEESIIKIYDMLGVDTADAKLEEILPRGVSLEFMMQSIASGNLKIIGNMLIQLIREAAFEEIPAIKIFIIQLVSVILIGSLFTNLSNSFGSTFVSENGFYVSYMIVTSLLLAVFCLAIDIVKNTLERILMLIRIIVPVYALSIAFVGHAKTSVGMYQLTLTAIWIVEAIILNVILPLTKYYVIISLINNINKEDSFSKLGDLIKNAVIWLLRTVVIFIGGLNVIKGLVDPQIDAIGRTTVNKLISVIPGGGMVSVLTGTFLGAGMVVKNSIGISGIILLLVIVLAPVVKIFLIRFMVRISMVMIQPLGEKRYIEGIDAMTQGLSLLLQIIASGVMLFVLILAVMAYSAS